MANSISIPIICIEISIILILSALYCTYRNRRLQLHLSYILAEAQAQAQAQDQDQDQAQDQVQYQYLEDNGIDQETIDSYPTVVVGGRGWKIQQDDNTCPICLCEYDHDDVLKILPECVHRFHRDCLVVWLRLKDTCPICRTHPPLFFL